MPRYSLSLAIRVSCNDYSLFKQAEEVCELVYENDEEMYVDSIDALKVGQASVLLGAGRTTKEDEIDHSVGILVHKKIGDKVIKGDKIATIYSNGTKTNEALELLLEAYVLTNKEVEKPIIIYETVR